MPITTQQLRYQLPKKAIKTGCPQCGPKHRKTLSCYVDTRTGELLPDYFGRCDRESKCGYHLSPYQKTASGMSYADEVFEQRKSEYTVDQGTRRHMNGSKYWQAVTVPERAPSVHTIPNEVITKSLGHYKNNQFARLLRQHHGEEVAYELLSRFQIGTSKCWSDAGACVFWLIDEKGRNRGGQIKLFGEDFHTVKYVDRDGRKRSRTSWVHSVLVYQFDKEEKPRPEWLTAYIEQSEFVPCLFGLPQLITEDAKKPIAIVESPKTAIIATPYFPQFIWMAIVARSYLNADRLATIKGRHIVLFPDLAKEGKDYQYWKAKAQVRWVGLAGHL